jgi:hypothetical protein
MRLLNAAIIVLALLATLGGYLQEKKRLATVLELSPTAARDLYEKAQVRRERTLMFVTAMLVTAAIVAVVIYKVRP